MSLPAARADEGIARALLRAQPQRFAGQPLTATMFASVRARAHATLALAFALLALAALLTALIGDAPLSRHLSSRFWVAGQRSLLKWLTDAGLYAGYACFIAPLVLGWWRRQRLWFEVARVWLAAQLIGGLLVVRVLKMWIAHPRPDTGAGDAPLQWLGLTWNAAYNSFPSGHSADIATSAFCLCLLLARPWQRAWVLGFAALIGLTRILLAKHWASDVLAGSAVGLTVSALIAGFWLRRLATGDAPA